MTKVCVFVRGALKEEFDFIGKMMDAAGLSNWTGIDLSIHNTNDPVEIGIAMGKICGRIVKPICKNLFIIPTTKQLLPTEQNKKNRQDAWSKLQEVKDFLEEDNDIRTNGSWQHAIVHLPGQKRICVYEGPKPPKIEADVFISREDSDLLLRVKEAFRAEALIIQEEDP